MLKTAIRFLLYDKAKTIGALLGVIIANFLIGQQVGVFTFLTNAMTALVDNTQTDLWLTDARTENVNAMGQIDVRFGFEAESFPGVKKAHQFVVTGGSAKFQNGKTFGVSLVGSQTPSYRGGPWNLFQGSSDELLVDGAVTSDLFDKKNLGGVEFGENFEIGGKRVYIAAETKGARGFGASYLFTTIERARALGKVNKNKVSAFLLELEPGTDPVQLRDQLNANLVGVRAWLPKDFSATTRTTILGSSGIALSTGTLIIFAIISGMVIIGLTLFSSVVDRIKDYATLKAIGASNGFVTRLILTQALIIALIGFGMGQVLVEGFRNGVANAGLIFKFSPLLRFGFFMITLVISVGGAMFAVQKITKAEPASVFRG